VCQFRIGSEPSALWISICDDGKKDSTTRWISIFLETDSSSSIILERAVKRQTAFPSRSASSLSKSMTRRNKDGIFDVRLEVRRRLSHSFLALVQLPVTYNWFDRAWSATWSSTAIMSKMYSTANLSDKELKEQGNRLFDLHKYEDAANCYTKAIVSDVWIRARSSPWNSKSKF